MRNAAQREDFGEGKDAECSYRIKCMTPLLNLKTENNNKGDFITDKIRACQGEAGRRELR
jgi:hypothetical protein